MLRKKERERKKKKERNARVFSRKIRNILVANFITLFFQRIRLHDSTFIVERSASSLCCAIHPSPTSGKRAFALYTSSRLHIASLIHMHRWKKQQYEEHPRVYSRITRCARLSLPFYLHTSQISFDSRSNEYLQGLKIFFFEEHILYAFPFLI